MGSKRLRGGGHGEQEVKGEEVMGSKRLRVVGSACFTVLALSKYIHVTAGTKVGFSPSNLRLHNLRLHNLRSLRTFEEMVMVL